MNIPSAIAAIAPTGQPTLAQRRRILINMCLKRAKPGTGSDYNFLQRRTAMNPWPDLRPILQDIPWAVVGAVATRAYMPERATKDLDILIHYRNSKAALDSLKAAGYQVISQLAIPGFSLESPEGVELDVIFGDFPWLDKALVDLNYDGVGYPVLGLPYLVLTKFEASRAQDLGDLTRMLGLATDDELDQVRAVVNRYNPEAVDDLESLIYLGQLEMKPPAHLL